MLNWTEWYFKARAMIRTKLPNGSEAASAGRNSAGALGANLFQGFHDETSNLLRQLQSQAFEVERETRRLQPLAFFSQLNSESHTQILRDLENQVGAMQMIFESLKTRKPHVLTWQRSVIERLDVLFPALCRSAEETGKAFEHCTSVTTALDYARRLNNTADLAGRIYDAVYSVLRYAIPEVDAGTGSRCRGQESSRM